MARDTAPIDASAMPDVSRLVQEVARTGKPCRLQSGDAEAVLSPIRPRRRRQALTPAEREKALQAFLGAWKGLIDPDQLKRELNELQRDDSAPNGA
ncbi:MAG TPA: hypothetical protein VFA70_01610 [Dehalococcoidia bacterium]|jgi:hypothetical protein|nr:hypothetical protein [Dehalococcoidia bacterium]